jgi:hypothetical protein
MFLGIFVFLIGFIWGLQNKQIVPLYYLFWITLLPYFIDIIYPFQDIDKLFSFRTFAAYYIFTMFFVQLLQLRNIITFFKKNGNIVFSLMLLIFYFSYLSIIRGVGFNYLVYLRSNMSPIFLFFYLSLISPPRKKILTFIILTTIIQIAIGLIQSFTSFGDFSFNKEGSGVVSFLTGAFTGNNLFADFLSFISIILLLEFKYDKQFALSKYVPMLVVFSAYLIFVSGIRLSLGSFIIGVTIYFFINHKNVRKYLIVTFIIGFVLIFLGNSFNPSDNVVHDWHATSNSERQSGLIGVLNGWEYLQYSTIAYSWLLISDYFILNPFLGSGLYFTSAGYGGIVSYKTSNATDVTLALYITEFGIIALLLLIFLIKTVFYNPFKIYFKKKIFIPLFVIILITITDSGIFDNIIMSYFYLYLFIHKPTQLEII